MACVDLHASDAGVAYTERKRQRHVLRKLGLELYPRLAALTDGRNSILCDPAY